MKTAFICLLKRLTAKVSRDSRFGSASGFWKQEIQTRAVLHFHVVLAGVSLEHLAFVHRWICDQWIDCVLGIPGMPFDLVSSEREKMLRVHTFSGKKGLLGRNSALQKITGNFQSYFAKYLGKAEKMRGSEDSIPGRWWGKFNAAALPLGKLCELALPDRVGVHAQRVARKIRQKRANEARHRAICAKTGLVRDGEPLVSQFGLLGRRGRIYRDAFTLNVGAELLEEWGGKVPRFGPYKFPPPLKFSAVRLTGAHVPAMLIRVLEYAGLRAREDASLSPF
jgi:hypothetical protein